MTHEKVILAAIAAGAGGFHGARFGFIWAALYAGAYAFVAVTFYDWLDG